MPKELGDPKLLSVIVLHHQQALAPGSGVVGEAGQSRLQTIERRRLRHEGKGALGQSVLPILIQGDNLHRDMPRAWVMLQLAEHRPAEHVREEDIQRDRGRTVFPSQSERVGPAVATSTLNPLS